MGKVLLNYACNNNANFFQKKGWHKSPSPHTLLSLSNKQNATQITAALTTIPIHLIKTIDSHIIYFFVSIPHSLYEKYSFHS